MIERLPKIGDVIEIKDVTSKYYKCKGILKNINFDVAPYGGVRYVVNVVNSVGKEIGEYTTTNLEDIELLEGEWQE
ncbi:MAG: hypothetical protein AB1567_12375, partial [bacterium]